MLLSVVYYYKDTDQTHPQGARAQTEEGEERGRADAGMGFSVSHFIPAPAAQRREIEASEGALGGGTERTTKGPWGPGGGGGGGG